MRGYSYLIPSGLALLMENKKITESNVLLSREEVQAIIGYSEADPVSVIKAIFRERYDQKSENLNSQLRFFIVCRRVLIHYKNQEISYVVMKLNSRLMNLIYSNDLIPGFKAFFVFLPIIFHFRNCVSIRDFKKAGTDASFIKDIREKMTFTKPGTQTVLPLSF
jgi:hypothetical protein